MYNIYFDAYIGVNNSSFSIGYYLCKYVSKGLSC